MGETLLAPIVGDHSTPPERFWSPIHVVITLVLVYRYQLTEDADAYEHWCGEMSHQHLTYVRKPKTSNGTDQQKNVITVKENERLAHRGKGRMAKICGRKHKHMWENKYSYYPLLLTPYTHPIPTHISHIILRLLNSNTNHGAERESVGDGSKNLT